MSRTRATSSARSAAGGGELEDFLVEEETDSPAESTASPVWSRAYARWCIRRWRAEHPDDPREPRAVVLLSRNCLPRTGRATLFLRGARPRPPWASSTRRAARDDRPATARPRPRLLTDPLRPEPLALFRILLGGTVLLSLLLSLAPASTATSPQTASAPDNLDSWLKETHRYSLLRGPINLPILERLLERGTGRRLGEMGREPQAGVHILFGLRLLALACLTAGLAPRPAAFAAWVLTVSFQHRLNWLLNGGDELFRTGLFYLILAPSGAAWSLDHLWWKPGPALISAWPVRLLQIQFCLIYLANGVVKLNADWLRGEAVYWVLNDAAVARWPYCRFPVPLLLCRLASWGTLVFEIGFPFFVLFRPLRPWLLATGVAFHAGIWLTTEVGWFSPLTLCWYALFLSPPAAERILRWLTWRR